ncbi:MULTISPECIES: TrfB-related DNA-binding protein [unclassified Thioalkalivibrio]|uniref:TrfB-related DNA-binding protein n=1 Tax=unclassified Thioalkalivibrio TaxID=2621013 RepID=UPI00037A63A4|nr:MULTISPECIES: TrfB-related DNA-binding protein [unclassified Thioalkalivibrio]
MSSPSIVTKEDFDHAARMTPLGEHSIEMAEQVILGGKKASEVAREEGVSRQMVAKVTKRIREAITKYKGQPGDWEVVTVVVPPKEAEEIRRIARRV